MPGTSWRVGAALACVLVGCNASDREPDVTWDAPNDAEDGEATTEVPDDVGSDEDETQDVEEVDEDAGLTDDAGDAAGDADGVSYDGLIADFLLDSLRLGDQVLGEGFDLDGLDTRLGDPYLPEDGPGGVDNQFGALVGALIDAGLDIDVDFEISVAIAEGRLLTLLRHRDVDDWSADPDGVPLYAYVGHDADGDAANNLAGDAEMLAHERSLADAHDIWSAWSAFPDGALVDTTVADTVLQEGDFEAGPGTFDLFIPFGTGELLELPIYGADIVWDLDTAPTGDPPVGGRIIHGLVGGHVFLRDAVAAFAALDFSGTTLDPETMRAILAGQADMDVLPDGFTDDPCTAATAYLDCAPGQTCEPDSSRGGAWYCYEHSDNVDALSVGFVFTAVSCRVTGVWDDPTWP